MPATAVPKKVSMIPAKPQYDRSIKLSEKKLRVAAYCRVSTELEEQESSYEAQVEYYTRKIQRTGNWRASMPMTERVPPTPRSVTISRP